MLIFFFKLFEHPLPTFSVTFCLFGSVSPFPSVYVSRSTLKKSPFHYSPLSPSLIIILFGMIKMDKFDRLIINIKFYYI